MPKFFQWLFRRKIMVRLALILIAFVLLVVGYFYVELWRGRRAWDAYCEAATARGVRLRVADFVGPAVPDAENYAAIPIVQEYFQASKEGREHPTLMPNFWGPLKTLEISKRGGPTLQEWRDALIKAGAKFEPTDDPAKDLLAILKNGAPALQQLRDASARPRCRFPSAWQPGESDIMPHLSLFMAASKILRLSVSAHLGAGDPRAAATEIEHLLRMYEALRAEPTMLGGLGRSTVLSRACDAMQAGFSSNQWTEAELETFERKLAQVNVLADLRFTWDSERGWFNTGMEHMIASHKDPDPEATMANKTGISFYPRGWLYLNLVVVNEWYDAQLARLAPVAGVEQEVIKEPEKAEDWLRRRIGTSKRDAAKYRFAEEALQMQIMEAGFLHLQIVKEQARIACALERFRRAKGDWPEKLDELVPQFLPAIPKDICDGAPMRYRPGQAGYSLWSVGTNRVDDGGELDRKGLSSKDMKDWVWKVPIWGIPKS